MAVNRAGWHVLWYGMKEPLPTALTEALTRYAAKHNGDKPAEIRACAATLGGRTEFDGVPLVVDGHTAPDYYRLMLPEPVR